MQDYVGKLVAKEIESRLGTDKASKRKQSRDISKEEITAEIIRNLTKQLKGPPENNRDTGKKIKISKFNKPIQDAEKTMQPDEKQCLSNVKTKNNTEKTKQKLPEFVSNKSRSDTTVYSPALKKQKLDEIQISRSNFERWLNEFRIQNESKGVTEIEIIEQPTVSGNGKGVTNESINDFVDKMRAAVEDADEQERNGSDNPVSLRRIREQELAEQAIINAEKFKANIHSSGMSNEDSVPPVDLNFDDNKDEEFSEGTCHVDGPTISKVCRGKFVEVVKLIPKQQAQTMKNEECKRLEFVNRDGMTYYVPSTNEREQKITNVRKWEQGFKVYAQIYSKANPHRAAEIWQYIYTINLAASSYHWDNVAYYDFMFRQQMDKYPQRSWRKINHQLWSLAMRDPISSRTNGNYSSNYNNNNGQQGKNFKENTCWRYNKNKCNRSAKECRYEHRCSLCGSYTHILINCPRNRRKSENNSNQNAEQHNDTQKKNKNQSGNKNTQSDSTSNGS